MGNFAWESSNLGDEGVIYYEFNIDLPINGDNIFPHGKYKESLEIGHLRDSSGNQIICQSIKNDPADPLNNVIINVACEPETLNGCFLTLLFKNT
jgi:hypothetical protein